VEGYCVHGSSMGVVGGGHHTHVSVAPGKT
jgi:hypothetical protein